MTSLLASGILQISIHALREEGDQDEKDKYRKMDGFQSTPSVRRATGGLTMDEYIERISIHALREEGDGR